MSKLPFKNNKSLKIIIKKEGRKIIFFLHTWVFVTFFKVFGMVRTVFTCKKGNIRNSYIPALFRFSFNSDIILEEKLWIYT